MNEYAKCINLQMYGKFNIFGKDSDKKVPLRMHHNTQFQVKIQFFLGRGHRPLRRWEGVPLPSPKHHPYQAI